jgi:hypothetical protein
MWVHSHHRKEFGSGERQVDDVRATVWLSQCLLARSISSRLRGFVLPHNTQDEHGAENWGKLVDVVFDYLSSFQAAKELLGGWAPGDQPARLLALLAAFLSVSEIPFGTTLGIYTLVVLLPSSSVSQPIRS